MSIARIDGVGAAGTSGLGVAGTSPAGRISPALSRGSSFSEVITDQLQKIDWHQQQADTAIDQLAAGQSDNVQDVVVSMAKADLTFRFALEIRNRLLESYQEIMRMQV